MQTAACVTAERTLMSKLEGGCQVPLGAHAVPDYEGFDPLISLKAFVGTPDGVKQVTGDARGSFDDPSGLGDGLATMLRSRGATNILHSLSPMRNGHKSSPKKKAKARPRRKLARRRSRR